MINTWEFNSSIMNVENIISVVDRSGGPSTKKLGDVSPTVIRSVAMSANIASTVQDEVKHLIKVNPSPTVSVGQYEVKRTSSEVTEDNSDFSDSYSASADLDYQLSDTHYVSICSHVLPTDEDLLVCAIVLSRWDDIMGPRTIRVWLPETVTEDESTFETEPVTFTSHRSVKAACQFSCSHQIVGHLNKALLMKAIKYVTSHTVNYTCVTGSSTPEQNSSAILVVPDLDMVAQSLMFHVPLSGSTPYSLALLVKYSKYNKFLPLRNLCGHWLKRLTVKLAEFLLSISDVQGMEGFEIPPSSMVDSWMVEMSTMFLSLQINGLGELSALQSFLSAAALGNPILERAVTSHLQTGGCTIVMGNNTSDINSMISFLALFLDEEARCCSRLVKSGQRDTFQTGLFLQGLLLDEFGRRDLSAEELHDNPLPVTWLDLSKSAGAATAVRQGLPLHQHQNKTSQPETLMKSFKGESRMVRSLLRDLRQISPNQWAAVVATFMQQLNKLALTLLSVIHWNGVLPTPTRSGSADNPTVRYLCATLHIDDQSFLMVLALADKIRPGVSHLVMKDSQSQ